MYRPAIIGEVMAQLVVLGGGKMGESLIAGLVASGWGSSGDIAVTARRDDRLEELRERYSVHTSKDNAKEVKDARIVVLAVKPQDIEALLREIAPHVNRTQTILSIVAGVPTAFIESALDVPVAVVRAMPNTPSLVHEGMAGIAPGKYADRSHVLLVTEVLEHVGRVVALAESSLDAVTAISGSGPAYLALVAEAMIEAGILLGLSRDVSTELVLQTMLGSSKLLRDEKMHPVELREMVTSPGGTTIQGIRVLEESGVRAAFLNAIQAAMDRSIEMTRG